MSKPIGISFSGGPNASEIVQLIKLAEDLDYISSWVGGACRSPVRLAGGGDVDLLHSVGYGDHQHLRADRENARHVSDDGGSAFE